MYFIIQQISREITEDFHGIQIQPYFNGNFRCLATCDRYT